MCHKLVKIHADNSLEFENGVIVDSSDSVTFLAIPPRLLIDKVMFVPELDMEFVFLCKNTPTWSTPIYVYFFHIKIPQWRNKERSVCISLICIIRKQISHLLLYHKISINPCQRSLKSRRVKKYSSTNFHMFRFRYRENILGFHQPRS